MSECDLIDLGSVCKAQDAGFLICTRLKRDSMRMCISAVSSNIKDASFASHSMRHDPRLFVGKSVLRCFSSGAAQKMTVLLEEHLRNKTEPCCSFVCEVSECEYCMTLVRTRYGCTFEIIPSTGTGFQRQHVPRMTEITPLFAAACTTVMQELEYDRAFVYQFQEDLSGKVVYERMKPGTEETTESWMDMFFPESDIPLPARQMYFLNQVRVIFDTGTPPADMIGGPGEVDLSKCVLRAVHPVHISYLQNMGVRSSLSIGIVVDSNLWGLLCFHSYNEAIYPRGEDITNMKMMGENISMCVSSTEKRQFYDRLTLLSAVADKSFGTQNVLAFFDANVNHLMEVLKADCICVRLFSHVQSWGQSDLALTVDEVDNVIRNMGEEDTWRIGQLLNPQRGVLAISHGDIVLVLVRRDRKLDKAWGGDPNHVKLLRPDGIPGPRGSFERYIQSGADVANTWDFCDKKLAVYLSSRIKTLASICQKTGPLLLPQPGVVGYTTIPTQRGFNPAFISHLSHELKTPLHELSSVLQLLLEDRSLTPGDTRQHLIRGLDCVGTASSVVDSVVSVVSGEEYLRIEKNRHLESMSHQRLVDSLLKEYETRARFAVTSTVIDRYDHVTVDSTTLHKTLCFMIENSLKFGASDVHLSVSCFATHREAILEWKKDTYAYTHRNIRNAESTSGIRPSDMWYMFSVRDSGCGIHEDMLDNVLAFKDDKKVSKPISKSHQGVGISMYECMSNIFSMNGTIAIASTVSEGSTVSIMVPMKVSSNGSASGADTCSNEDLGTFFVVDDNVVNQKLAARLVQVACRKKFGVAPEVKTFSDGRCCVAEMKRMRQSGEKVMGILMDHHMPVMSGKEAAVCIREMESREGTPKTPIFGFTADSTNSTKEELMGSGMDDVLPKPLSVDLLEDVCVKMVKKWCVRSARSL